MNHAIGAIALQAGAAALTEKGGKAHNAHTHLEQRVAGEQRARMAIGAHAQKDKVDGRHARAASDLSLQPSLIILCGGLCAVGYAYRMYGICGDSRQS